MKVSIGIYAGKTGTGLHQFEMIDIPGSPKYALAKDVKIDTTRPHVFKFEEQDQFCRPITHAELEAELTK